MIAVDYRILDLFICSKKLTKRKCSMSSPKLISLLFSLVVGGVQVGAETHPDNSKVNADILANSQVTAQDQGNSAADVELTRKIRQAVVARDSFSSNAKNVKIITFNGVVTLKGPVKTAVEKREIQQIGWWSEGGKSNFHRIVV